MPKWNPLSSSRGDQGELFVGLIVSKMGHLWHPSARREIAVDGDIELFSETHEATSLFLSVQVKTRSGAGERRPLCLQCDPEDIAYWREADRPVLVVLVDPDLDRAWFVCIQEYFSRSAASTNTLYFDPDVDRFDVSMSTYLFELAGSWRRPPRANAPGISSSIVTSRRVLQRFHHVLTQALIDRRRELTVESTPLFLDADIAVVGTLPLQTALTQSVDRLQDDHIYSTMLWRLGYLGQGTLLRPHAVEFTRVLEALATGSRAEMATLLRHDLTRRALAELRIAIHDPDAPVSALMEQLRRIPRETAILIAGLLQASQPLHSISKVLEVDDISHSNTELMGSPLFEDILCSLRRLAPGAGSTNTLTDAFALTILAERVRRYRSEEIESVGYFATQTARIVTVLRDERLQHLFSPDYPTSSHSELAPGPESVLRTSEYLICRSTFRCLRRRESLTILSSDVNDSERLTLDAVEMCAAELAAILGDLKTLHPDPDEWFRLERLPMSGITLVATVEYLKSLASLDAVWLADNALGLRRLCQETKYSDVEEFVINNYTEMITWTQQEFANRIESIAKWRSAYNRFVKRRRGSD
jgi:hypothetical protein